MERKVGTLSRNRFAICLRGIAQGAQKVVLMLSYPSDVVESDHGIGRRPRAGQLRFNR